MTSEWITVLSTHDVVEAAHVCTVLAENNINAVQLDKRDSVYGYMGYIEIKVNAGDANLAAVIISKLNDE